MRFLHYLVIIPLLAAAIWGVYMAESSADGIVFVMWSEAPAKTKVVLGCCILFGYIIGRINAWFDYAPLRRKLRQQIKANKNLNKEQVKLSQTVTTLKQDIIGLQEKAKIELQSAEQQEVKAKNWWTDFKQKITDKKGM